MEQPESNPTFCTNNCGFYGSSQFEGMCSKCYREHVSRSMTTGRTNSCNSFYATSSSNPSVSSTTTTTTATTTSQVHHPTVDVQQTMTHDDQDEVIGRMDEDNEQITVNQNIKMDDDDDINSESPLTTDEITSTTTKQDDEFTHPRTISIPTTAPMAISRNIDIPTKNETTMSYSVMEASSLADSMSPLTASSVDKKKRSRCAWPSCNKKLGLTGFDCRCGGQFCPLHRYANEHNCTFDYKEHGQNEIRKNMPVVQAERVRRI